MPKKTYRVLLGELIFVSEGGHFRLAAPINEINNLDAKAARRGHHVNSGVARADARDSAADLDFVERPHFGFLDEFNCAVNTVEIFAGKIERPSFAQSDTDEDSVELFFEIGERDIGSDYHLLAKLHSQLPDQINLANRIGCSQLVRSDAIAIQAAWELIAVKDRDVIAPFGEFGGAGQRRRARTDTCDALAVGRACAEEFYFVVEDVVHGVALQASDFDR